MPTARCRRPFADLAWLALACIVAGVVSVSRRQDANWDLANYHLYNPWAWLNGRYGFDLAPAQLQTFLNPLLDVPFYAMVAADWPPRVIAFVLAVPAGVAAFAVGNIAALLLRDVEARVRPVAVVVALAIGLSGTAGIGTLGNTMNEWPGAALVGLALWRLVHDVSRGTLRVRTLVLAGLLAGVACGLKLTAATSAVGLAMALLLRRPFAASLRNAVVFGIAVGGGLAMAAGHWLLLMNELYGNPVFPFFNQIFQSPLLPPEAILDRRFGPRGVLQWLALPFDLFEPPPGYVVEVAYRDPRFPVLATLSIVAAVVALAGRSGRVAPFGANPATAAAWRLVAVYLATTFIVWSLLHAYYRYLLPLELLSGVAIVGLALAIIGRARSMATPMLTRTSIVALAVTVVASTNHPDWGRVPFGATFLDVRRATVEPNALVLLTMDAPMAYVLTRFPPDARHVGVHNNLIRADGATGLRALAARIIDAHEGPIYQLTVAGRTGERELRLYGLRRADAPCGEIATNLGHDRLELCRVWRIGR